MNVFFSSSVNLAPPSGAGRRIELRADSHRAVINVDSCQRAAEAMVVIDWLIMRSATYSANAALWALYADGPQPEGVDVYAWSPDELVAAVDGYWTVIPRDVRKRVIKVLAAGSVCWHGDTLDFDLACPYGGIVAQAHPDGDVTVTETSGQLAELLTLKTLSIDDLALAARWAIADEPPTWGARELNADVFAEGRIPWGDGPRPMYQPRFSAVAAHLQEVPE